jgi:hypothetical protein
VYIKYIQDAFTDVRKAGKEGRGANAFSFWNLFQGKNIDDVFGSDSGRFQVLQNVPQKTKGFPPSQPMWRKALSVKVLLFQFQIT